MSLTQVIKAELYKISHRKSSLLLGIPLLLAFVISLGYSQGVIKLNLTVSGNGAYSCMDFVFMVWTVLSGLGIIGILLLLFASLQFAGEIERGQVKLMLLRVGNRSHVLLGKYLAVLLVVCMTVVGTIVVCIGSYYFLVGNSAAGDGSFFASAAGVSALDIFASIGLQVLMYLVLAGLTFLIGVYMNPFVTFVLTMVFFYGGNYLAGSETFLAKLLPVYWSNQLILNGTAPFGQMMMSVCAAVVLAAVVLRAAMAVFQKKDIK